jgi:hypothetical protein
MILAIIDRVKLSQLVQWINVLDFLLHEPCFVDLLNIQVEISQLE